VDIGENAPGKYRLYEPGFFNISLPFVLSFAFRKTNDSSKGPILNAFEIYKYIHIDLGSPDGMYICRAYCIVVQFKFNHPSLSPEPRWYISISDKLATCALRIALLIACIGTPCPSRSITYEVLLL